MSVSNYALMRIVMDTLFKEGCLSFTILCKIYFCCNNILLLLLLLLLSLLLSLLLLKQDPEAILWAQEGLEWAVENSPQ